MYPYRTDFDITNAYWMARLAKKVYAKENASDKPNESKILENLQSEDSKFDKVTGFNKSSAQGMVASHEKYIAVVFRGTDEMADWLDNINAFSTKVLFGAFHRGFYQSVQDIWAPMDDEIKRLQGIEKRPVWFTGHSLGGAMAAIAAAMFVHEDRPFSGVYTFGQPRCMDRDTCRIFNMEAKDRFHRFQNNNDIVTRIPSRLMGYSHVGRCIYISEEKELHSSPGWWFKFLDSVDGALEAIKENGFDGVEDHDMAKYLEAIKKWKNDGKNLPNE